jgi:hypothetical protein
VGSIGLPTGQQLAEGMSQDDLLDRKVLLLLLRWQHHGVHVL